MTAWKQASKNSSLARTELLALASKKSGSHESKVRCRFFLIPGGDSKVAFSDCCSKMDVKPGCASDVRNNLKSLCASTDDN